MNDASNHSNVLHFYTYDLTNSLLSTSNKSINVYCFLVNFHLGLHAFLNEASVRSLNDCLNISIPRIQSIGPTTLYSSERPCFLIWLIKYNRWLHTQWLGTVQIICILVFFTFYKPVRRRDIDFPGSVARLWGALVQPYPFPPTPSLPFPYIPFPLPFLPLTPLFSLPFA